MEKEEYVEDEKLKKLLLELIEENKILSFKDGFAKGFVVAIFIVVVLLFLIHNNI